MHSPNYAHFRIGIIGGGQLGKMTAQMAKKMGFYVAVLDPTPDCPASKVSNEQITGGFYDRDKLRELTEKCDVTTYDIEHIDASFLKILEKEGNRIFPYPETLEIIQDKYLQKQTLQNSGIPVPGFRIAESLQPALMEDFGMPVVQKARKGGYDGRGVHIIRTEDDLSGALNTDFYLEEYVQIEKELAVMVARNEKGEVKSYPVVEMLFDDRVNICDIVAAPARIHSTLAGEVESIAVKAVEALDGVGIFGVEMFLGKDGSIYVNEIAPRPHNSGHYTIEACLTSQFEQHIRAISGLPLGSTHLIMPAVMINLLGDEGYTGFPVVEGLEEVLAIPGVSYHFYGKRTTRPFRKMGHITILRNDMDEAIKISAKIKSILKIKGEEKT